ncbi:hypothetical protein JRI60_01645 [Archangium violaceum]|uniref:hypothetical protein n=1 Tax=Archangium violaceum TaxID=83451 RepID=UPI001951818C|nr:hypothetical protein [Archangium violaceum]QRN97815.1 hypothetical protein JRI60_01645 [Archangium violaceum]
MASTDDTPASTLERSRRGRHRWPQLVGAAVALLLSLHHLFTPSKAKPAGPPQEPPASAPTPERSRKGPHQWIQTVGAVAALILSLHNLFTLHRRPPVRLSLPHLVRIAQGPREVWLYLQPTFTITSKTEQLEVISGMELKVGRVGMPPEQWKVFVWNETGEWVYDPEDQDLTWKFLADPTPLIVSQSQPQSPIGLFIAERLQFEPGDYEATLTAHRTTTKKPLEAHFCLRFSEPDILALRQGGQWKWHGVTLQAGHCEGFEKHRGNPSALAR